MPNNPLSPEVKAQILASWLTENENSCKRLAEKFKVSKYQVSKIVNDHLASKDIGNKTLFADSGLDNPLALRQAVMESATNNTRYARADWSYYVEAIAAYSVRSNTRRTKKGWVATARNFLNGDAGKGRLVERTNQVKNPTSHNF